MDDTYAENYVGVGHLFEHWEGVELREGVPALDVEGEAWTVCFAGWDGEGG